LNGIKRFRILFKWQNSYVFMEITEMLNSTATWVFLFLFGVVYFYVFDCFLEIHFLTVFGFLVLIFGIFVVEFAFGADSFNERIKRVDYKDRKIDFWYRLY